MSQVRVPKSVPEAIRRKEEREASHRHWWGELARLAKENNIKGFYRVYAEYLKAHGVISPDRKILYDMARAVEFLP